MTTATHTGIGSGLRSALLICLAWAAPSQANVIYVDVSAQGSNSGTSWADAFTDLQSALAVAGSGTEIWVAQGTYRPAQWVGNNPQAISFEIKNGIALYGGFEGGGSTAFLGGETDRSQRDVARNETILSGDLIGNDGPDWTNRGDNSYHVVKCGGTDPVILDGFTVRGGDGVESWNSGGGIDAMWGSSATIVNCTIVDNQARSGGGIIAYGFGGVVRIDRCTITKNRALIAGGGIVAFSQKRAGVVIQNCTISDNSTFASSSRAGGISCLGSYTVESDCIIIAGCVITANAAAGSGGAIACSSDSRVLLTNSTLAGNSAPLGRSVACNYYGGSSFQPSRVDIRNSILWDPSVSLLWTGDDSTFTVTYSNTSAGLPGTGNMWLDPMFVDAPGGDFRLSSCSPCIDAADNAAFPSILNPVDRDGSPRFVDDIRVSDLGGGSPPVIDMGAFEFQDFTAPAPPQAPQQVVADASLCTFVGLQWNPSPGAASYVIKRNTTNDFLKASVVGTSVTNSYDDFSAQRRVNYWYWVTAARDGCIGRPSLATPGHRRFIPGDMDSDCDVDQEDFGLLQACFSGVGVSQPDPNCIDARLDGDTDVDLDDAGLFLACFGGPSKSPPAACLEE